MISTLELGSGGHDAALGYIFDEIIMLSVFSTWARMTFGKSYPTSRSVLLKSCRGWIVGILLVNPVRKPFTVF